MIREMNALSKVHRIDSLDLGPVRGPFLVTEKVDGSQISFGVIDGVLMVRSKGRMIDLNTPQRLFMSACEHIKKIQDTLEPNWIYRGETLQSARHNKLKYDRVPNGNIALFGISPEPHRWVRYEEMATKARLLGMEPVPVLDRVDGLPDFEKYLELDSFLGGCKIEGVVLWPLKLENAQLIKFVSPSFRETKVRKAKLGQDAAFNTIVDHFKTNARWDKAIQHLRDDGRLKNSDKDIGPLLKELHRDFDEECTSEAKELLWQLYGKKIKKELTAGFADYYRAWAKKERDEGSE